MRGEAKGNLGKSPERNDRENIHTGGEDGGGMKEERHVESSATGPGHGEMAQTQKSPKYRDNDCAYRLDRSSAIPTCRLQIEIRRSVCAVLLVQKVMQL